MADEDDIRELIERMAAAKRQGFHVTPGAMRIVLTALRFYLSAKMWLISKPLADPRDDAPRRRPEPYTGPLPTIAETKGHGVVACEVQCTAPDCWNTTRITFDALGLPDEAAFVDIPKLRRFRCSRCGCREVRVSADWRDHKAAGNGRSPAP